MANNTFRIEVKTKGKDPIKWLKQVDGKIHFQLQQRLVELGVETAFRMQEIIKATKKRKNSSGRLEKSIDSQILRSTAGVHIGIGQISKLPIYWEVINDGGYIPPSTGKYVPLGSFEGDAPSSTKSGQIWEIGNGLYSFLDNKGNKKPIQPFLYIDISAKELRKKIQLTVSRFLREAKRLSK